MLARFRVLIQSVFAVITNGYLVGFVTGKIYTGRLKNACLPGLNCYSCPGAVGSCPLGSLQAALGGRGFGIPFYVLGFLLAFGALFGRLVCGFLCPFGLIQQLLHKIKFFIKIDTFKFDRLLRWLKYVILIIFVILLPMFAVDFSGLGSPAFCKYICPAGTLEAGIPLVLLNESLRGGLGFLYLQKNVILVITIIASIIIYRPFCKYICPLGAIYSLFNKVALFRLRLDSDSCISCKKCSSVCKMKVDPTKSRDDLECIRCLECTSVCPTKALSYGFTEKSRFGCKNGCQSNATNIKSVEE